MDENTKIVLLAVINIVGISVAGYIAYLVNKVKK
jgi:hypothetical protein